MNSVVIKIIITDLIEHREQVNNTIENIVLHQQKVITALADRVSELESKLR